MSTGGWEQRDVSPRTFCIVLCCGQLIVMCDMSTTRPRTWTSFHPLSRRCACGELAFEKGLRRSYFEVRTWEVMLLQLKLPLVIFG